ncbi:hypothetical protein [Flavobacterium faecale]|uniref:hypothetical protein n=1 Tax=Flavobacterium faecale TaxID=1355330 RepID=UPI003AAA3A7D
MKNLSILCLLIVALGFESCKNNESKKNTEPRVAEFEEPTNTECYQAIYQEDTLDLKLNTMKDGDIKGQMVMNIVNRQKKIGELVGKFRGDTLFASYTFTLEKNKKVTYKNPMAFLKKDNQLILGNGKIETSMGASYFVKDSPIDFDKVKYKFSPIDCAEFPETMNETE